MKKVGTIIDFADGAIAERLNDGLRRVIDNIADLNTDEKPRRLVLEVVVTPQNNRKSVSLTTMVKTNLRPTGSVKTQVFLQRQDKQMRILEYTGIPDGQKDLFGDIHEQKFISLDEEKEEV